MDPPPSPDQSFEKATRWVALLFFSFLLLLSWYYFKERTLCFDPSFYSFRLIQEKGFCIPHARWGASINQVIPLLFLKAEASLGTILRSYSMAFILVDMLIAAILLFGARSPYATWALMLTLCLGFRHDFFYATAELFQGMAFTVLLWPISEKILQGGSRLRTSLFVLLGFLVSFLASWHHQLTLFPVVFLLGLFLLYRKGYKNLPFLLLLSTSLLWFLLRITVFTWNYGKSQMPSVEDFVQHLPHFFSLPSWEYFKGFAIPALLPAGILFLAGTGFLLLKSRNILTLLFTLLFPLGFLILIVITYHAGESPIMYENHYTIFGFIAGVTACLTFKYEGVQGKRALWFLIPVLAYSTIMMERAHLPFTQKIAYNQRLIENMEGDPNRKYLIHVDHFQWDVGWVYWPLPFETLLLSSLENSSPSMTFSALSSPGQFKEMRKDPTAFLGPEWAPTWFWSHTLNQDHFQLPKTPYKVITTSSGGPVEKEQKEKIRIHPRRSYTLHKTRNICLITVDIINHSNDTLHAHDGPDHLSPKLSYHITGAREEYPEYFTLHTNLEMDLPPHDTIEQGVRIFPIVAQKAKRLRFDLITDKKWWNVDCPSVPVRPSCWNHITDR